MKSTHLSHEKLYLVTPDVYDKIMTKIDTSESNEISSLNNEDEYKPDNLPLSMNPTHRENNDNFVKENENMSLNSLNQEQESSNSKPIEDSIQSTNLTQSSLNPSVNPSVQASNQVSYVPQINPIEVKNNAVTVNPDCNQTLPFKPYLCVTCNKRYATPFTLKRHRKTVHGIGTAVNQPTSSKLVTKKFLPKVLENNSVKPAEVLNYSRKRKLPEDMYDEIKDVPAIKHSRRNPGVKRKFNDQNIDSRKKMRIENWEEY